jgi:bile acid transporter
MSERAEDLLPLISLAILFLVGLGLGASTTLDDFRKAFKTPKAVAIGFLSQYLFMPIAAFLLTLAFQVRKEVALGTILIGCSPGGTTSNLFTYWCNGDVALSVTMSFMSTIAAFGLMPFWIWVLIENALDSASAGTQVDWITLFAGLLLIVLPTCLGLALRNYNTELKIGTRFIWKWVEIVASVLGAVFLIVAVVLCFLAYGDLFSNAGYEVWSMCVILQPLGCAFGYFISKMCGMSSTHMRTISLETGVQNFSLAVAVIQLSFKSDADTLEYALMFPVCYGLLYLFWSPIIVLLFRYCCSLSKEEFTEAETDDQNADADAMREEENKERV